MKHLQYCNFSAVSYVCSSLVSFIFECHPSSTLFHREATLLGIYVSTDMSTSADFGTLPG